MDEKRPIRIAGASGSASDRRHAFSTLAANYASDPIDVIIGDWLSEANMTSLSSKKILSPSTPAYEPTFLESLSPALENIAKHGIRVAVNAGGSDTKMLYEEVRKLVRGRGLEGTLKVAWIEGDDVLATIQSTVKAKDSKERKWERMNNTPLENGLTIWETRMESGEVGDDVRESMRKERDGGSEGLQNLCTGEKLSEWEFKDEIIGAQAYLGGLGIAKAFQEGASIVICGRVSDASPVIGAAVWWHGWTRDNLDELANTFVAGHLIECSTYVCGGNFTGFKDLEGVEGWEDIGYPIAEISTQGEVVITKQQGTGGTVSIETCKAQLLYEIQGPWYFNSDITAVLDQVEFVQLSTNRVALQGIHAQLPPPTTKVGITADGGWQAEVHWFLVGLDLESKARMLESQIKKTLGDTSRFSVLKFMVTGTAKEDPRSQEEATVGFRVFAQAKKVEDIVPGRFLRPIIDLIMSAYPGATFHLDIRQGFPRAVQEYFVALMPQSDLKHVVHMESGIEVIVQPPTLTKTFPRQQPSQDVSEVAMRDCGETVRGPLGWIVHARSGDKGSNANVGFWVRYQDEYDWLRALLSTEKLKDLLAKEYSGNKIDRFELPNIWAVHFLLHNHLDRGASCSSTYDFLAKNVAEFLRSRHVDLPKRFLNRGKL